jgi:hypothetical protein
MLCSGEALYKVLQTGTVLALRSLSWYIRVADLMSDSVLDKVYLMRNLFILDTKHTYLFQGMDFVQRGDLVQGPGKWEQY